MRSSTETVVEVYWDRDGWRFRTVHTRRQLGDTSVLYSSKTKCLRDARLWHPGVPVVFIPKENA